MTPSPSISPEHQRLLENASWLQRLAESLVRDPHHADDMAQQTMEAALGGSPPHSNQHRPWLARILRNKVYANHRQQSRRQAREQRVARKEEQDSLTHDTVERAEIGKRLTESIMRLKEPFRTTLLLRFHEDLSPKEIARKLNVPASTVRTRIHRGLENLREDISNSWGKDWQRCYPAVLAFSKTGVGSGLKVGSLLLPLALIAGIASTLFVIQPWQDHEPAFDTQASIEMDDTASLMASLSEGPDSILDSPNTFDGPFQRQTIPSSAFVNSSKPNNPIILKGRVVAKETGKPLVGCTIQLAGIMANTPEVIFHDGPDWEKPGPFVTSEDGMFEFSIPNPHPNLSLLMDFTFPGRISWRGRWGIMSKELASTDLGDVSMKKGVVVKCKVVHENGSTLQKAKVSMDGVAGQILTDPTGTFPVAGATQSGGEFGLNTAIPPGPRNCKVRVKGYLLVGPNFVVVEEDVKEQVFTFVMKSMPYIDGIVLLPDGSPAEKIRVTANKGSGWIASADTDAMGYFRIHSTTESEKPFTFTLSGSGFQWKETAKKFEWGQRGVTLGAAKSLSAQILVLQDSNHDPLVNFTVLCTIQNPSDGVSTWQKSRFSGPHPGGVVHLDGLNAGTHKIEIVTADPKWQLREEFEIVLPSTEKQPFKVFMVEGQSLQVKVMDTNKNEIAGSTVVVGDSFPLLEQQAERGSMPSRPESILLLDGLRLPTRAETDENGIAQLFLPKEFQSGGLHISGAHLKRTIPLEASTLASGKIEIVVQPQSEIKGKLVFPESMNGKVGLFFENQIGMGSGFGVDQEDMAVPNENGSYTHRLDPGLYKAFFMTPYPTRSSFGFGNGWARLDPPIGEFQLEEGFTLERDWDVSHFAPGSLTGRILVDGTPKAHEKFSLFSHGSTWTQGRTDEGGHFQFEDLPANPYQVYFQDTTSTSPWAWMLMSENEVVLQCGQEVSQDFHFRKRTLRLRPLHPETKEPFPNALWRINLGSSVEIQADAEGWIEISPASSQPMSLTHRFNDDSYSVQNIQMDADKTEQSMTVTATYPIWR